MQQLMTARITEQNEQTSFRIIDSAIVPWNRSKPSRRTWTMGGGFLGLMAVALWIYFFAMPKPLLSRSAAP